MYLNNTMKKIALVSVLIATSAMAQTPYDEGQKAMREQRWMEASRYFEEAKESDQADAAMYWRANALYKAGHRGDAARQIRELESQYPESRWMKEAKVLQLEYEGSINDANVEDELRLFALMQLIERDVDRALPLVVEIMNNTESESVRRDAMFVLGMSESPEARKMIAEMASNSNDAGLQADAIGILGVAGDEESLKLLAGLYESTNSREVKESIIHAHMASDSSARLGKFLALEQDPELQREIIYALGAMGDTAQLQSIYANLGDTSTRTAAIEAFAIAGDSAMLMQVLETETDPSLRSTAIEGIAISGTLDDSSQFLVNIYNQASHQERQAIIEAMMISQDAPGLIGLMQKESDPGLRREMMQMLAVMDTEEADEYLFQMLESDG